MNNLLSSIFGNSRLRAVPRIGNYWAVKSMTTEALLAELEELDKPIHNTEFFRSQWQKAKAISRRRLLAN